MAALRHLASLTGFGLVVASACAVPSRPVSGAAPPREAAAPVAVSSAERPPAPATDAGASGPLAPASPPTGSSSLVGCPLRASAPEASPALPRARVLSTEAAVRAELEPGASCEHVSVDLARARVLLVDLTEGLEVGSVSLAARETKAEVHLRVAEPPCLLGAPQNRDPPSAAPRRRAYRLVPASVTGATVLPPVSAVTETRRSCPPYP